ncbi:hypothetical protein CEXT_717641 [Caerostris extrusa]|uniref:Uncharacterized protein n=1 Tax=Caerostris extrusa TaxID=172846 RepID=A0AAV4YAE8_CAEEX|nr:hypothetical protein CEXT_717641 [Caerostris extrusa]
MFRLSSNFNRDLYLSKRVFTPNRRPLVPNATKSKGKLLLARWRGFDQRCYRHDLEKDANPGRRKFFAIIWRKNWVKSKKMNVGVFGKRSGEF